MPEVSIQTNDDVVVVAKPRPAGKPKPGTITIELPAWILWGLAVLVGVVAVVSGCFWTMSRYGPFILAPADVMDDVGIDGVMIFRKHDRDDDGVLTLEEFEPIVHRLRDLNETVQYIQDIKQYDEILTIETAFMPFVLSSMNKNMNELFAGTLDSLYGLKTWKTVSAPWKNYAARHFSVFMPSEKDLTNLGKVYKIYEFNPGPDEPSFISSNRYYPPTVERRLVTIHQLLAMFHPRPFVYARFQPQGAYACVRAYNEFFIDIEFRIHAEFQLNEPPFYPFWFTPAQFMGNLIISRDGKHVVYFHMFVPNDRKLNVDLEWLNPRESDADDQNMEVDIGLIPLMELRSTDESRFAANNSKGQDLHLTFNNRDPEHVTKAKSQQWLEEIAVERARKHIEIRFYPFKRVPYYNFTDAFSRGEIEKKPIHSILLWGALDDQSC